MYIIILDNKKKLHKYVNSLSQSEIERSRFFIISDGGDISKKDLPKKADYTKMNLLIPPPDIIERFNHLDGESDRARTEQSFFVSVEEIAANDYDFSINKYKEVVYEAVQYEPTDVIMGKIEAIEAEIQTELAERKKLLG